MQHGAARARTRLSFQLVPSPFVVLTIRRLFDIVGVQGVSINDADVPSPVRGTQCGERQLHRPTRHRGASRDFSPLRTYCHSAKSIFLRIMRPIQIPVLNRSPSPSILLVSSLAAVIPAPTRSLYVFTNVASTSQCPSSTPIPYCLHNDGTSDCGERSSRQSP